MWNSRPWIINTYSQKTTTQPNRIETSEKPVTKVITVIGNKYINPFGFSVNKSSPVNLSSGGSVEEDTGSGIMATMNMGYN